MSASPNSNPVSTRLRHRIAAYPPAGRHIHQAVFANALPRVAVRRMRSSRHPKAAGLARAVDAIRGVGIEAAEASWIDRIEARRSEFAARDAPVPTRTVTGEHIQMTPRRLSRISSIHRPWGVFLHRLVRELRPRSCVELGSAIGISAAYQAAGLQLNGVGRLRCVEGAPRLVEAARETLAELDIQPAEVIEGRFDDVLEPVLAEAAPIDLVFLDAGKQREPNLQLFDQLLPHMAPGAAFVMDDVHWSREMHGTWKEIRAHEQVALSVDLWRLGACLLRS